jgi:hypothetical protein
MSRQKGKAWFVPLENLLDDRGASLINIDELTADSVRQIQNYEALTISLESFCVSEQFDKKVDGNDPLVRTWTTYGDEPPVEIVHFFEKNVPLGEARDNLAVEHMFATESYLGQPIELEFQILEVDGDKSIAQELKAAAYLFGAVFPALLPFSSLATTLYTHFKGLFKNPHDLAFSSTLRFQSRAASQLLDQGVPLCCGAYVLCDQPIQGNQYALRELKLEAIAPAPSSNSSAMPPSYVVIKIVPQIITSLNREDLLANQKLAASLLKSDDEQFELPPNIAAKRNRLASSFHLLKNASKNAIVLKRLITYKNLKSLSRAAISETLSKRNALERAEKMMALSHEIKTFFSEDDND